MRVFPRVLNVVVTAKVDFPFLAFPTSASVLAKGSQVLGPNGTRV